MNLHERGPLRSASAACAGRAGRQGPSYWCAAFVAVMLLLAAGPLVAQAAPGDQVRIYSTDSPNGIPINPDIFEIGVGVTDRDLELYIVKGAGNPSGTGTVCANGDGQETCGFEIRLQAQEGLVFTSFLEAMPSGDAVVFKLLEDTQNPGTFNELRVAGTKTKPDWDPQPPDPEVPLYIGKLTVSTPANPLSKSRVVVTRGRHVDAAGELVRIPEHTIAAPEAPQISMLLAGAALLGMLNRMRRRKLARRTCV